MQADLLAFFVGLRQELHLTNQEKRKGRTALEVAIMLPKLSQAQETLFTHMKSVQLSAEAKSSVRNALVATIKEHTLQGEEKLSLREDLMAFVEEYPVRSFVPLHPEPFNPWVGTNLFALLKPFCV